ncbi:MAG: hypothetical protein HKM89_07000 [Gemmatimonadales bacterium]|nr:hypothetical protein [Gemmatimonadales bacterium]
MSDSKLPPDLPDRLGFVVEGEARRLLAESELEPDPTLVAEGWERRFIADKQRAEEAMELYRSLGYEVCAIPLRKDDIGPDCDDCQLVMLLNFTTIYTRKKPAEEP